MRPQEQVVSVFFFASKREVRRYAVDDGIDAMNPQITNTRRR